MKQIEKKYEAIVKDWEKASGETMCTSLYGVILDFVEDTREEVLGAIDDEYCGFEELLYRDFRKVRDKLTKKK